MTIHFHTVILTNWFSHIIDTHVRHLGFVLANQRWLQMRRQPDELVDLTS